MKRILTSALGLLALCSAALAQPVPQTGVTFGYVPKQTFSAAFFGLVPPASATDMVCIAGSATKKITVTSFVLSGTATTAVSVPVTLLRRASVDTGGTAASTTANPANTIAKHDSTFGTATAVPISYTAVPTIVDSSPTYIAAASLNLAPLATAVAVVPLRFDFGKDAANLLQAPTLRGIAQQFCLNFGAVSVTGGVLNGSITWTEE
jgi:hypothetical protein